MTMDSNKPTIASLLGADAFAPLRHESASKQLTALLDQQPSVTIPDKIEDDTYLRLRDQLAKSSTLAAMAGDSRLENYVNQWTELQKRYGRQIIDGVTAGLKKQKEDLELYDQELREGEAERRRYEVLGNKKFLELTNEEIQELQTLKKKVLDLDKTAKDREETYRAVQGVSSVEQTLTALIQSGHQAIHYIVPSVKEAQQKLGENKYDGPVFEPFKISNSAQVSDMFLREVVSPNKMPGEEWRREVRTEELHPILSELVQIYQHVLSQSPDTVINPGQVSEILHLQNIGVKGLGNYLEANLSVFGVQKQDKATGSRTFIRKESGKVLNPKAFIEYMLDQRLQGPDAREVNEFYLQKALALLRETAKAYMGFTKEDVHAITQKHGLPVGRIYVSRNLRHTEGLTLRDSETETFVFSEIIPTATQVRYVQEAISHFGISRFTPGELVGKVRQLHSGYDMPRKVGEKALQDHYGNWGLKIASTEPLKYQREDRTIPSAATNMTANTPERLM